MSVLVNYYEGLDGVRGRYSYSATEKIAVLVLTIKKNYLGKYCSNFNSKLTRRL